MEAGVSMGFQCVVVGSARGAIYPERAAAARRATAGAILQQSSPRGHRSSSHLQRDRLLLENPAKFLILP
jgi:hypothetical protein